MPHRRPTIQLVLLALACATAALACPPGTFGTPCTRCPACRAGQVCPSEPVVELTKVPPLGQKGEVLGRVYGLPSGKGGDYGVAALIKVGHAWWCKPTAKAHVTKLASDGSFRINISTGPHDIKATAVHVYLVRGSDSKAVPVAMGEKSIPAALKALALAHAEHERGLLQFSGESWHVKDWRSERAGPGPNFFEPSLVSVNKDGALEMAVKYINGAWRSSEVWSSKAFGYGTYEFVAEPKGGANAIDANLIFGAFTWDVHGTGRAPNKHRELDFEFARWGKSSDPTNAQFVVQPHATPGNLKRITIPAHHRAVRCVMKWVPNRVSFSVFAANGNQRIAAWEHASGAVPDEGSAQWRFNFWQMFGKPPVDTNTGRTHTVVVKSFKHTPEGKGPVGKDKGPRAVCVPPK